MEGHPLRTGSLASDVKSGSKEIVLNLDLLITVYAISVIALFELVLILNNKRNEQTPSQRLVFAEFWLLYLLTCL